MTRRQRLVRDYEQPIDVSKAMIHGALGNPLLQRIAKPLLQRIAKPSEILEL